MKRELELGRTAGARRNSSSGRAMPALTGYIQHLSSSLATYIQWWLAALPVAETQGHWLTAGALHWRSAMPNPVETGGPSKTGERSVHRIRLLFEV